MAALILGGIVFQDFEIPENIPLGGAQAGQLHKIPGGIRVFDAQGPDDEDIKWTGRFRGASALDRAMQLDGLRRAGAEIQLTILSLSYSVVIQSFTFTIMRPFEIEYSISLYVIEDQNQGIDSTIGATLDSIVSGDIATGAALLGAVDAASTVALVGFKAAVAVVPSLQTAGASALQPVKTAAFALTSALGAAQSAQDALIVPEALGPSPIDTGASGLLATLQALQNEVALLEASAYLGRAASNIENATG